MIPIFPKNVKIAKMSKKLKIYKTNPKFTIFQKNSTISTKYQNMSKLSQMSQAEAN